MSGNFNPRAPYGARPAIRGYIIRLYDISIHAPHTGRDFRVHFFAFIVYAFQSTRPIRGATITVEIVSKTHSISIHAPHTGRDDGLFPQHGPHSISIHAPHTGRDLFVCDKLAFHKISIHAPHTGRDGIWVNHDFPVIQISIHAPHTGRDVDCICIHRDTNRFQSTRPIRGATFPGSCRPPSCRISIHAPHTGRDSSPRYSSASSSAFQSTRPIRGATAASRQQRRSLANFNPRAPYGARPKYFTL